MPSPRADGCSRRLEIRLFGQFSAERAGMPLPRTRTRREQWLLALLALRAGQAIDRDWLAGMLWPDASAENALYNLRRSLSDLRRVLAGTGGRIVAPSARTVGMELPDAWVDAREFDAAVEGQDDEVWERALALYRGPFLAACTDGWAIDARQAREHAYLRALERVARRKQEQGQPDEAAVLARRALAVDPLLEPMTRLLMESLAAGGQHAAVVHTYRNLRLRLRQELGIEPSTESATLYQRLRSATVRAPEPERAFRM